jgi:hypothetical protein
VVLVVPSLPVVVLVVDVVPVPDVLPVPDVVGLPVVCAVLPVVSANEFVLVKLNNPTEPLKHKAINK